MLALPPVMVCLVHLVCLVYLVCLVCLVEPDQLDEQKKPDEPDKPDNRIFTLADFFSILLGRKWVCLGLGALQ